MSGFVKDTTILGIIADWENVAVDEVDEIGVWLDASKEERRNFRMREWTPALENFLWDTKSLSDFITSCHPKLDPMPLHEIYVAIKAWHEDWNASRIPEQNILSTALERARLVLSAIRTDILNRQGAIFKRDSKNKPVALTPEDKTILETLNIEGMTIIQNDLAVAVKISDRTVRKRLKYLKTQKLVDQPCGPKKGYAITEKGKLQISPRH